MKNSLFSIHKQSKDDVHCLPFGACNMPIVVHLPEEECKRKIRCKTNGCDKDDIQREVGDKINKYIDNELERIKQGIKDKISHKHHENCHDQDDICTYGYDRDGFDRRGFDKDGFNGRGYDQDGYDEDGFDRRGYDKNGFDVRGYDKDGFDENGFDRRGFDKDGLNRKGFDKDGYDKDGYDKDGLNRKGFDKDGYNKDGFDRKGGREFIEGILITKEHADPKKHGIHAVKYELENGGHIGKVGWFTKDLLEQFLYPFRVVA
ncbi:MAG: hypothetical protein ACR5LA_06810 [Wolbachia sp.]